jgi:hypothetical protein
MPKASAKQIRLIDRGRAGDITFPDYVRYMNVIDVDDDAFWRLGLPQLSSLIWASSKPSLLNLEELRVVHIKYGSDIAQQVWSRLMDLL